MRKIILTTLATLGLTGGVAMADPHYTRHEDARREVVRDHRDVRVVHYRDFHSRPVVRFERHEFRRGYRWRDGEWRWNHYEWVWTPGVYIRVR